jgi:hypothetical protein
VRWEYNSGHEPALATDDADKFATAVGFKEKRNNTNFRESHNVIRRVWQNEIVMQVRTIVVH